MTLKEKLLKEKLGHECIFLYRENGCWFAYEDSGFFCLSIFRGVVPQWLDRQNISDTVPLPDSVRGTWLDGETVPDGDPIFHVKAPDPGDSPLAGMLHFLRITDQEIIISCRLSLAGFGHWRKTQLTARTGIR